MIGSRPNIRYAANRTAVDMPGEDLFIKIGIDHLLTMNQCFVEGQFVGQREGGFLI